jgi:hypothetical protein
VAWIASLSEAMMVNSATTKYLGSILRCRIPQGDYGNYLHGMSDSMAICGIRFIRYVRLKQRLLMRTNL